MKIQGVTPADAASDPKHPDHDRWVKETTLKMEAEHAKRLGRSFRDAETENAFWLQRAEARAREKGTLTQPKPEKLRKRKTREERLAERPVSRLVAKPKPIVTNAQLSPCGRCGVCIRCKREKRVYAISQAAKKGEMKFHAVLWRLGLEAMQARDRTGRYFGMSVRDANRVLIRIVEDVCDATVMQMGPWR